MKIFMKNFTKKDYEKEIVRFCQILTQQKYDEKDDKMIKRLISENLEHVSFDATIPDSNKLSKKIQVNKVLKLSSSLVNLKYGTREDKELKRDLGQTLGLLSRCIENARISRAETSAENKIKRMVACF